MMQLYWILFVIVLAMILLAVFRRREYKQRRSQPYAENSAEEKVYDVDSEEFTSFYDQYRTQE